MPIFEYACPEGHITEAIRSFATRDDRPRCKCGTLSVSRIEISQPHIQPDGVYSYMPNLGNARDFERRRNALESGQRVIKREVGDG